MRLNKISIIAIIFFAIFYLMVGAVMADVEREILSQQQDAQGTIEIHTQWKVDGVEVPHFDRQGNPIKEDGKFYWTTRHSFFQFGSMTKAGKIAFIEKELDEFGKDIIKKEFTRIENKKLVDGELQDLVGRKKIITEAEIEVDNDGDHATDKIWVIKKDGTKVSEKNPTP